MKVVHVVGARPNYMKIAPVMQTMALHPTEFQQVLVHTGQHYDVSMSQVFFDELGLPQPDANLEVGSGSHAWQTAEVMLGFEPVLLEHNPDWLIVPGDVNSTVACALVASKLGIKVAHVEAGLRSFDRTMPEEINRVLTDHLADLLFTTEASCDENLRQEGISPTGIHFVGNTMIDTLIRLLPKADKNWPVLKQRYELNQYVLVTLHRPSNVDNPAVLGEIMAALRDLSRMICVIFPVHPRTRQRITEQGLLPADHRVQLEAPLGYLDFLALQAHASLVLTDSGGVQEETTYLGVPCLTARPNTERPVTVAQGTNRLVTSQRADLLDAAHAILSSGSTRCRHDGAPPKFWDGHAAERIVNVLREVGP